MKNLKITAAVLMLCASSAVSYWLGYNAQDSKNYEAACLQADFIRYCIDHFDGETECFNIVAEIENSYEEYFQELPYGIYNTKHIKDIKDFDEYGWCY